MLVNDEYHPESSNVAIWEICYKGRGVSSGNIVYDWGFSIATFDYQRMNVHNIYISHMLHL